jgi:diaminopimelate epimerase
MGSALDLGAIGPPIEADEQFPNRTNVSWYTELEAGCIRARIFERGAGETLSSGTGACGAAVAYVVGRGRERAASVTVVCDGGQLVVGVGDDLRVNLTGWARPVFEGRLSEGFASELHETE